MCCFKSGLILKDRVFIPDYDSHVDMLKELKISDDKPIPDFVKVEFLPPANPDLDPSDYSNWIYRIDQDVLPEWYVDEIDRKRFIEEFKIYVKDKVAINQEITKESKNYKVYINCTGSLKEKTGIELIYNCKFKSIENCLICILKSSHITYTLTQSIVNNIFNCNIGYVAMCYLEYSRNNSYLTMRNVVLSANDNDMIEYFIDSCAKSMSNSKVDVISNSIIKYHTTDKNLEPQTRCLNSVIINHNTKTNNHQIDFLTDREEEKASLEVKYSGLDKNCIATSEQ